MGLLYKFGERLQHVIRVKKSSRAKLARAIERHTSQITRWCNAEKPPKEVILDEITQALKCTDKEALWLETGEGEKPQPSQKPERSKILTQVVGDNSEAIFAPAGRDSVHISGNNLSQEEQALIKRLREVGGTKMINRFLEILDEAERQLDKL